MTPARSGRRELSVSTMDNRALSLFHRDQSAVQGPPQSAPVCLLVAAASMAHHGVGPVKRDDVARPPYRDAPRDAPREHGRCIAVRVHGDDEFGDDIGFWPARAAPEYHAPTGQFLLISREMGVDPYE